MDVQLPLISNAWQKIKALISAEQQNVIDEDSVKGKLSLNAIAQCYPSHSVQSEIQKTLLYTPLKADKEEFVGRETQQQQMTLAIERWQHNQGEITAVIGPFGCGISSFLNQFHQQYTQHNNVTYLSFYHGVLTTKEAIANLCYCFNITDAPNSITAAITLINQQPQHIIIIDDLHKLMLRMMGNYQALVTFATILMETRQHHCWILGCETFVWHRLSSQYSITNFVKSIVKLNYFSQQDLANILKQKTSKISLQLTESNDEEVMTTAFDNLAKQLHQASDGHPKLACVLLHQAIVDDGNSPITLNPILQPDLSSLKQCIDEDLFSLAEIYVHGGLRVFQHAEIFATSIEHSSLKLEYLARQGLVKAHYSKQDFAQHYYLITPTLTQIIAVHLLNHNKLYL